MKDKGDRDHGAASQPPMMGGNELGAGGAPNKRCALLRLGGGLEPAIIGKFPAQAYKNWGMARCIYHHLLWYFPPELKAERIHVSMRTAVHSYDLSDRLSAFGIFVEGTSLYLLRAIETTVDNLEAGERLARAVSENANLLIAMIREKNPIVGRLLDPEDKVINELETAYRGLEEHLPKMLLKKGCIDGDTQLDQDQCELLHTAYDRHIEAFAQLIESAKNLRAAIITHDLAAEPRSQQSVESIDHVIGELRSSPAA